MKRGWRSTRREFLLRDLLAPLAAGASLSLPPWLLGCSTSKPTLQSGAYVQNVTPNAATVSIVAGGAPTRIRFGPSGEPLGAPVPAPATRGVHSVRLTDLDPNTRYTYRIETSDGRFILAESSFRTAPAPDATSFVFAALGDSGGYDEPEGPAIDAGREALAGVYEAGSATDRNQQRRVAQAMGLLDPPDLIVHMGDVAYPRGAREAYRDAFFSPFASLISSVPVYPTLGNHDIMTQGGAAYLEFFSLPTNGHNKDQRTYSFDWANAHFVSLDSSTDRPTDAASTQLQWLDADLASTDRPWKIVFLHKPIFSAFKTDAEDLKELLLPIFERHGVDLVLSGHEHLYARFAPQSDITWVVTGGGGRSLYPVRKDPRIAYGESVYHYLRCEVDGDRLRLRAIDARGETFDELTLVK